jgi:hypothetical protein
MGKVTSEISMSLDGFITGPNMGVGNGMGDDGDRLHDWRFDAKTETDAAIVDEIYALDRSGPDGEADVRRRIRAVGRPSPVRDAGVRSDSRRARAAPAQPCSHRTSAWLTNRSGCNARSAFTQDGDAVSTRMVGLDPSCGLNADSRRTCEPRALPDVPPDQGILLWTRGELNP